MKILVISYLFPNSLKPNHGIFVLNRIKALSQYVDIKVINPIPWSPLHGKIERFKWMAEIPEKEEISGIEVYHPRFFSIPKVFKSIESLTYFKSVSPVVKEISKSFPFDLIDLHWTYPDLPAGVRLADIYNKPLFVTLRGLEAFHLKDSGLRKNLIKHYLSKTDRTIALSKELAQVNTELIGQNNKSRIIRNGVDTDNFYFQDQTYCRQKLGLSLEEKIIVSVGSLIKRKGFDVIINALIELKNKFKHIRLYIIGSEGPEGDYRQTLFQLIKENNLEQYVIFKGQIANNDLNEWYNAADAYCLASRGEGSPNVLTEALACGCPAVATSVGAVNDIMESEKNLGLMIESENVTQMINALDSILSENFDRKQNAQHFNKYNWDWCAKNVYDVYQEII